jgi:enoyl-[acyl-carrier protein] reductase I
MAPFPSGFQDSCRQLDKTAIGEGRFHIMTTRATKLQIRFDENDWALILGGFGDAGLATARKLAACGMNLCLVSVRGEAFQSEQDKVQLQELKKNPGVRLLVIEEDCLRAKTRVKTIEALRSELGSSGKVKLVLQTIPPAVFRVLAEAKPCTDSEQAVAELARVLKRDVSRVQAAIEAAYDQGHYLVASLFSESDKGKELLHEHELADIIRDIGINIVPWIQALLTEGLFAPRAQVLTMTHDRAERPQGGSCAAIYAALATMTSLMRSLAVELAPYGIRTNVLQPGAMDTPYGRTFPLYRRLGAAVSRVHREGRITQPGDVAEFIALLCTDQACWLNGALIHFNDAEHLYQTL